MIIIMHNKCLWLDDHKSKDALDIPDKSEQRVTLLQHWSSSRMTVAQGLYMSYAIWHWIIFNILLLKVKCQYLL